MKVLKQLKDTDTNLIWPPPWRWWVNSVYTSDDVTASVTSRITALKEASFSAVMRDVTDAETTSDV